MHRTTPGLVNELLPGRGGVKLPRERNKDGFGIEVSGGCGGHSDTVLLVVHSLVGIHIFVFE